MMLDAMIEKYYLAHASFSLQLYNGGLVSSMTEEFDQSAGAVLYLRTIGFITLSCFLVK